ncbi:hypothetical protein G6F22_017158 [Rhizopus arrhizus]|nr:hypothetical protein G6F22_017158 [Rhizopus arrhizus]
MPAAAPATPAIEGSARRWRRLAWWSLFVAGNAVLAAAIALGNVPLRDNPGGGAGLAYLAIALPGHLLAFGALAGLLPLLLGLWPRSARLHPVPLPSQCHGREHGVRRCPAGPGGPVLEDLAAGRAAGCRGVHRRGPAGLGVLETAAGRATPAPGAAGLGGGGAADGGGPGRHGLLRRPRRPRCDRAVELPAVGTADHRQEFHAQAGRGQRTAGGPA